MEPARPAERRSLAFTRICGLCWTPGWTSVSVTERAGCGGGVSANAAGPAAITTAVAAAPRARTGVRPAVSRITMPVLAATMAKLTSHTPPTAASASTAGCCHWLAPSSAHGPPNPCQERIHSITSQ